MMVLCIYRHGVVILVLSLLITAVPVFAYETVEDAAIIARRLVDLSANAVGTMATVFPPDDRRLPGQPFSLQEYYASCYQNGSLTLLFLPISRHSQNILHSSSRSASISISSDVPAASRARVSLIGNVTIFKELVAPNVADIRQCYLKKHSDASRWLPDDEHAPHIAYWARFDPHTVYFVGGFGDEHYIGYIPLPIYQLAFQHSPGDQIVLSSGF